MVLKAITDIFPEPESRPNTDTLFMGKRIREAREEAGFSQEKLAKLIFKRQATLSDIENGKVEVDASTLNLLSYHLRKPFAYFFRRPLYEELVKKDMNALSLEMQMQFEQIFDDDLKKLAIEIVKNFAKFNPKNMVQRLAPMFASMVASEIEIDNQRRERDEKHRKKK